MATYRGRLVECAQHCSTQYGQTEKKKKGKILTDAMCLAVQMRYLSHSLSHLKAWS